jgi:hypothetical protein
LIPRVNSENAVTFSFPISAWDIPVEDLCISGYSFSANEGLAISHSTALAMEFEALKP